MKGNLIDRIMIEFHKQTSLTESQVYRAFRKLDDRGMFNPLFPLDSGKCFITAWLQLEIKAEWTEVGDYCYCSFPL